MKPTPRDTGQLYVDRTAYLHKLITCQDGSCFFLALPRRFCKSLMITTLKEIFNGFRSESWSGSADEDGGRWV